MVEPSQQGARVTGRYDGVTYSWYGVTVTLVLQPQYSICKNKRFGIPSAQVIMFGSQEYLVRDCILGTCFLVSPDK